MPSESLNPVQYLTVASSGYWLLYSLGNIWIGGGINRRRSPDYFEFFVYHRGLDRVPNPGRLRSCARSADGMTSNTQEL